MLTLFDEFAGWGGSSQGAAAVPGVEVVLAANHSPIAVAVHSENFPDADHYLGDVTKAEIEKLPRADLFWASPSCPPFTDARGEKQYFDQATRLTLFDDPGETPEQRQARLDLVKRRALMEEVPRYLRAMARKGEPVLAGVVENVIQVVKWDQFPRWVHEIETAAPAGYTVKLIALDAMHAPAVRTRQAPQSRARFFAAYILNSIGRLPDWDKWLRPRAWCPRCEQWVDAVQVFKDPRTVMGRYGVKNGQYVYRCPRVHGAWRGSHRPGLVEPDVLPAFTAIDWTLPPGAKIGERVDARGRPDPLKPATIARIEAGIRRYATPITLDVGGHTFERTPGTRTWPISGPLTTFTTTGTRALAVPPLLVPVENRADEGTARPASVPLRTQTARQETAVVVLPFLASLRGGGARETARGLDEPLLTFSANGTHHALVQPPTNPTGTAGPGGAMVMRNFGSRGNGGEHCTPLGEPLRTLTTKGHQSLVTWGDLLLPYYSTSSARPTSEPLGTLTTRDRYALIRPSTTDPSTTDPGDLAVAVEDCTFRMLAPHEIAAGMAFAPTYKVHGTNRQQVAGYGNAVCPPAAEVIVSALVEAVTGQELPR